MAITSEDDLAFEEMSDEQLAMEAADLRSAIEAINLDLMDDAKGNFWRSEDWRIRARGARAYKQADLKAANALLAARKVKQEAAERDLRRQKEEATRLAKAERRKITAVRGYVGPDQLEAMRISLEKDRLKTERHLISEENNKSRDRQIIRLFQRVYGIEAYRQLIALLPDEPSHADHTKIEAASASERGKTW